VLLFLGVLVASFSFGLLSSESASSKLKVDRTVRRNFRAAYDILVRPVGVRSAFERKHHLVDDGFLSSLFGGITMAQYRQIRSIRGVSLVAPVANVGYYLVSDTVFVPFPEGTVSSRQAVYRGVVTWSVHNGLLRYPGAAVYLYHTPKPLTFASYTGGGTQLINGRQLNVCSNFYRTLGSRLNIATIGSLDTYPVGHAVAQPYRKALQPQLLCSSPHVRRTGAGAQPGAAYDEVDPDGRAGVYVAFSLPVLVSGIDPDAEERLAGLKGAMTTGRYLNESAGLSRPERTLNETAGAPRSRYFPVIASIDTFVDEAADIRIERLVLPDRASAPGLLASSDAATRLARLPSVTVGHTSVSPTTAWRAILPQFNRSGPGDGDYWQASSARYTVSRSGVIEPVEVANAPSVWTNPNPENVSPGTSQAPPGAQDVWYRHLRIFGASSEEKRIDGSETNLTPVPLLTGTFDPAHLRTFSAISKVPLQTFFPPTVTAANQAARHALGSRPLGPTTNLGGYLSQPPLLLTTIKGAIALDNGDGEEFSNTYHYRSGGKTITGRNHFEAYQGASPRAPISTIEVRVAGVTGPNQQSLARIEAVAQQIKNETGLTVDITAGSSPHEVPIKLAPGHFSRRALLLKQGWVEENVDSAIIESVSRNDLLLFVLIAVVCVLFAASSMLSSVRRRRHEIGVLRTVGWPARQIFTLIVGEAGVVGILAGLTGIALTLIVGALGSLDIPSLRVALVLPVAFVVAILAAIVPAAHAASIPPIQALTPRVTHSRRVGRHTRGMGGLALANLARSPGRTIAALLSLALAVATLSLVLSLQFAFKGTVAGDLLGNTVILNIHSADLTSAILTVIAGSASAANALYGSIRERRSDFATLRALGWRSRDLTALVFREAVTIGTIGPAIGAAVGIIVAALLGGSAIALLKTAVITAAAGCALTLLVLLPAIRTLTRSVPAAALTPDE
jgi:hypothetical protein